MSTSLQAACSNPSLTGEQPHAIGVDAYLYLYPLILMDLTRKPTNLLVPASGKGSVNMFVNVPACPPADFEGVLRSISLMATH